MNMGPLSDSPEMEELLAKEAELANSEDPQLPDAGDEQNVDAYRTVSNTLSKEEKDLREIRIYGTERGGIVVEVKGKWNGRLLRAIPSAIVKQIQLARREFISMEE